MLWVTIMHAPFDTIHTRIREVATRLRTVAVLDGTATVIFAVSVILGCHFAIDRFFESGQIERFFMLLAVLGITVFLIWCHIIRRAIYRPSDIQLATVLERYEPQFNDSLLTAVQLRNSAEGFHPQLLDRMVIQAAEIAGNVRLTKMFRYHRLWCRCVVAGLLVVSLGIFAAVCAETFSIWFGRAFLLANHTWPRQTRLEVLGFDDEGVARIARGDTFSLVVAADTTAGWVPDTIQITLTPSSPSPITSTLPTPSSLSRKFLSLNQFHIDDHSSLPCRIFSTEISELVSSVSVEIIGGDAVVSRTIEVVSPPLLTSLEVVTEYPSYILHPPKVEPQPTSRFEVPAGSTITWTGNVNKPLRAATATAAVSTSSSSQSPSSSSSPPSSVSLVTDDTSRLQFSLPDVQEPIVVEWKLIDTFGITNRVPLRWEITPTTDQKPTVAATVRGVSSTITNIANVPVEGQIRDDFGIGTVQFRHVAVRPAKNTANIMTDGTDDIQKDKDDTANTEKTELEGTQRVVSLGGQRVEFDLDHSFSVASVALESGDKLSLYLEAADLCPPSATTETETAAVMATNRISAERWDFEIVSPEKLRGILEAKEIGLRQRFETLIEEVRRTCDLLAQLPPLSHTTEVKPSEKMAESEFLLSRALRDTQKEVFDLRQIAMSFAGIRLEMLNNFILRTEDKQRLDEMILTPMYGLIETDFPELVVLLQKSEQTQTQQAEIAAKMAEIIAKMIAIRDSMTNMETFNEVVELLRGIIRRQESLRNETQEKRRNTLRDLL